MTPCLFGLYSVIALASRGSGMPRTPRVGYTKKHATFSDALEWTGRELWETTFFNSPMYRPLLKNIPRSALNPLSSHLALGA